MNTQLPTNDEDAATLEPTKHHGSIKKIILLNNIRVKLLELLRFLEVQVDGQFIDELSTFLRCRSQLESYYSSCFERITQHFEPNLSESSNKCHKPNSISSTYNSWKQLLNETQSLSFDYATLSSLYNHDIISKLQCFLQVQKKYHDLLSETYEEILRILRNFYTTLSAYRSLQLSNTASKLEVAKAKNIYKYYVNASTTFVHKKLFKDVMKIIYAMDSCFCLMTSKAILAHLTPAHKQYFHKIHSLEGNVNASLDSDPKIAFLANIKQLDQLNEGKYEDYIRKLLQDEFEQKLQVLRTKEMHLHNNLEKNYKALSAIKLACVDDYLQNASDNYIKLEDKYKTAPIKSKLSKRKEQGKFATLTNLSPVTKQISFRSFSSRKVKSGTKVHIVKSVALRPKLFGGNLEEYLRFTKEDIPLVVRSCIRVISQYGLHSQGIFRVSGSQVDILQLRDSFERGEDPLAGATDASDINSVAGVLKLYLRELEEPLFPNKYFDIFFAIARKESKYEMVSELRNFFKNIPKAVVIVIKFLFAFLNHLTEFANENMMDAYNLAVSFGPTLMPAPEDNKQVQYQTQLNELVKILIIYQNEVFPRDLGGLQYDKGATESRIEL